MKPRLFKLFAALLLVTSLAAGWLLMDYQTYRKMPLEVGEEGIELVVEPGMTLAGIARELEQRGAMTKVHYLVWMGRLKNLAHRIQAGEYRIKPGTTPKALLEQLVQGDVRQYAITLVEGWNFRQVMQAIKENGYLRHTLGGLSDEEVMARLGHPGEHPEGRFFPDTYHFPRGTSDVTFLQRSYQAMQAHLSREWPGRDRDLPYESPYQALILASIVEKETGLASERHDIAGVFVRRLKKGIRLQTDPTVIYGLGLDFDGNLRRRDLQRDNPYNTYRRRGLPPTPIAMPGGDAIDAALHPAAGEALYFVSRGDGSHHFSATLEEHNRAVIQYQLKGRVRSFSSYRAGSQ